MLDVRIENLDGIIVLRCAGRIVRGDETAILCSAADLKGRNVIVDLRQVDAIDAAGIGALVSLQAAGIYLKLANPTDQVREILKVTKLDSIFEICESQSTVGTGRGAADAPALTPCAARMNKRYAEPRKEGRQGRSGEGNGTFTTQ